MATSKPIIDAHLLASASANRRSPAGVEWAYAGQGIWDTFSTTARRSQEPPRKDPNGAPTVLHHCIRTLILRLDLSEPIFTSTGINFSEETQTAIKQSASGTSSLRTFLDQSGINIVGTEVPILANRPDGAVINGLIDLLGRGPKGFFVLDHKSDFIEDPIASASAYLPQLSAYVEGLTSVDPNAGAVDVAINWLSLGAVTLFDRDARLQTRPYA